LFPPFVWCLIDFSSGKWLSFAIYITSFMNLHVLRFIFELIMVKNILGLWFTNGIIKLFSKSQADLLHYEYCEFMYSNLWSLPLKQHVATFLLHLFILLGTAFIWNVSRSLSLNFNNQKCCVTFISIYI
jgi:hypothetical protein